VRADRFGASGSASAPSSISIEPSAREHEVLLGQARDEAARPPPEKLPA
jgi:hypothetical protein